MDTVINILVAGGSFYIGGKLLKGVEMENFVQCIIVALLVGFLDFTLGTVLKIVSLGILSFGVFTWSLPCQGNALNQLSYSLLVMLFHV